MDAEAIVKASTGNEQGYSVYRTDDVDIKTAEGGYTVGWMAADEWLAYTVNVASAGPYTIRARVVSVFTGRTFHSEADGVDVTGAITVPQRADWDEYEDVAVEDVPLHAGTQVLRVVIGLEDFIDLQGFTIEASGAASGGVGRR